MSSFRDSSEMHTIPFKSLVITALVSGDDATTCAEGSEFSPTPSGWGFKDKNIHLIPFVTTPFITVFVDLSI